MAEAVKLAYQGRGATAPNPCVGAVLVDDDRVVAQGWHTRFGKLHAERECLADAKRRGVNPAGMTMYVTLEPCNHHGKTPPCTEAIIEAKVGRVMVGALDPNPKAAGGVQRLRDNGIEVVTGVLERECLDLLADFRLWQESHSTFNILKMAATLDGKIASRRKVPEAVSCARSFEDVHELRSKVGAVVVGGNTFYADNPSLTCRQTPLPEDFTQPLAVVATSRLPESDSRATLIAERAQSTIFWTTDAAARSEKADALRALGVRVWPLPGGPGCLNLALGFERLRYEYGVHYTLCEGGGGLAMQLMEQGLADEIVHYVAPRVLGDNLAPSAYSGRGDVSMRDALNLRITRVEPSGTDIRLTLRLDDEQTISG